MSNALDSLKNLDLGNLGKSKNKNSNGTPLLLELTSITEDPTQPRKEFDQKELQELADDIKKRGVISPISVHEDGTNFVINFGARRYRASKLAGLHTIPVFIDNEFQGGFSQLAENIHRAKHSPKEIARFIQEKIDEGFSKKDIAKELTKQESYVTNHLALLDLPEILDRAYDMGLIKDPQTIYLAKKGYPFNDQLIIDCVEKEIPITRRIIADFEKDLKEKAALKKVKPSTIEPVAEDLENETIQPEEHIDKKEDKFGGIIDTFSKKEKDAFNLYVLYNGKAAVLNMTTQPKSLQKNDVSYEVEIWLDDDTSKVVNVADLKISHVGN